MLAAFKSGTAHGQQVFAALQGHLLRKRDIVNIALLDRMDIRSLKQGVRAGQIGSLLILDRISKDRCLNRCIETDALADGKLFAF